MFTPLSQAGFGSRPARENAQQKHTPQAGGHTAFHLTTCAKNRSNRPFPARIKIILLKNNCKKGYNEFALVAPVSVAQGGCLTFAGLWCATTKVCRGGFGYAPMAQAGSL
jgi:hypothetical protein